MTGIPEIVLRLLEARGIAAADFEAFFNPSVRDLPPPDRLPGVPDAAAAILDAVAAGRRIVVFGDYDCDGVSATAIVVMTLTAIAKSAAVTPFLPLRLSEGYGMSDDSVARMLREIPDAGLVVTVDNGVNAIDQIAALKARGVGVVVTDHHLPTPGPDGRPALPDAVALVNPKVAAPPELSDLCGAGVAFLLANALVNAARERGLYSGGPVGGPLLVLAGLATVTDVMPLVGPNRILVAEALRRFRTLAPIGLRELHARASRFASPTMEVKDFGFQLGPRINASGRLASGMEALELILAEDREVAREAARIVDSRNTERKGIEQRMLEAALAKVVPDAPAQVIVLPDGKCGEQGVAGIVAARIMEKLAPRQVPVCVIVGSHGSARAPEGYNVRDALAAAAPECLERFGGHALAAGLSVREGAVDRFRERFAEACRAQRGTDAVEPAPERVDAWLEPADLTLELCGWIDRMRPFGEGNPEPVFGLRGMTLRDVRPLGADGRHLSLAAGGLRAVWWGHGGDVEALRASAARPCDITFHASVSDYGETHVELRVVSVSST